MKCHVSVVIILTRAEVTRVVDVVLIYKPTGNICIRKNGRKFKLKVSVITDPKDQGQKTAQWLAQWTRIKTTGMWF